LEHGPAIVRRQPVLEVKLTDLVTDENELAVVEWFKEVPLYRKWSSAQAVVWARGPHSVLGLEALPLLRGEIQTIAEILQEWPTSA
jgi:hypothetical protein